MRALSATLEAKQKVMGPALVKLVLTKATQATKTYGLDTTDRILYISHSESEWSQTAHVTVNDPNATLAALSLQGYLGTISWGYKTSGGDEYSACAPLEVIAQTTDSRQGQIVTSFGLAGIFDMMDEEKASEDYSPDDTNTDTIKTILTAIAEATLTCFNTALSHTITFDSEDDLIDSYMPADYFQIRAGESRLSAFRRALKFTKCKAKVRHDGVIHVFNPTISGSTYDSEYRDALTYHNFFDKSVRKRLVIPNKIVVSSHPDHAVQYTGSAVDTDSYDALGRYITGEPVYIRATSNAQCTAIATAMLQHIQIGSEKGYGLAPMNCGQEVMDYVLITDSRVGDTRAGNIGYLNRWYSYYRREPTRFGLEFSFGSLEQAGGVGGLALSGTGTPTYADLRAVVDYVDRQIKALERQTRVEIREVTFPEVVAKLHVTEELIIPVVD